MIWTLKVECIRGQYLADDCIRIIEIDSKSSLFALHDAIQDAVGFGRDHLFEFFASRSHRNRKLDYVDVDNIESDNLYDLYDEISLEQIYPLPKNCILYYHFDFGDDWYFKVRKIRKKPQEPNPKVHYPRVIESIGPNLIQYPNYDDG